LTFYQFHGTFLVKNYRFIHFSSSIHGRDTDEYESRFPEDIDCLSEGLEDSLQFYYFSNFDKRKISSTNILERLNREIRRRTRFVGIFPSRDTYIQLVTIYVLEYTADWLTGKAYSSPECVLEMEPILNLRVYFDEIANTI